MSGTVAQISGKVGDAAGASGSPFTNIVNPRRYTVAVSVGESDIASIRKGQRATVSVDAVSGLTLAGHVTSVGLVPDSTGSAVTYPVTVTLDEPTTRARAGMTASVRIVTARASGLVIPSQALRGSMVVRVTAGEQTTTRVQTGLAGDDDTIVADGLSAGDEVVETSASALAGAQAATQPATATSANPATPSFGGGFRRGGGPPSFR